MGGRQVDFASAMARLLKYILEGSTVGFAAFFIPKKTPDIEEVVLIAVIAAATFSIVDLFSTWGDSYSQGAGGYRSGDDWRRTVRQGAAFNIGTKLTGGLMR